MEGMNKGQKNEESRKSSLEHYSNNYCRQGPTMNAEITGEKLCICILLKYLLQDIY